APDVIDYGYHEVRVNSGGGEQLFKALDGPGSEMRLRSSEIIVDAAIDFLERNADEPVFMNLWLLDPHEPIVAHQKHADRYSHLSAPYRDYFSVLTNMDQEVGRLLGALKKLNLDEETLVVFTSDNGPEPIARSKPGAAIAARTGPLRGCKRSLYDGGIRVPMIARWPSHIAPGNVDSVSVASGIDLFPTVCALARLPSPTHLDGESLEEALYGEPSRRSNPLVWAFPFTQRHEQPIYASPMLALRTSQWKLLMNPDRSRVELYQIRKDMAEVNNLASEQVKVVRSLSDQLLRWYEALPPHSVDEQSGHPVYHWRE
ncbi:MAG: sulfatase-like hydrolase/transferase, partial [Myxococcota bacterium]|nr:sulfatase-like hydrolase/transferase [Myxococcota bacterium]